MEVRLKTNRMIVRQKSGFTILELLLVITLLGVLLIMIPGLDGKSLKKLGSQGEIQKLVDHLRWAQRRAVLDSKRYYLTLDPGQEIYWLYTLDESEEKVIHLIQLHEVDLMGMNRTVKGMLHTFYFTPDGSSVFGCTITLKDQWNEWKVIIAIASGKIRVKRV